MRSINKNNNRAFGIISILGGLLAISTGAMPAVAQQCEGWFNVSGDTPTPRSASVFAYDSIRDLSFLYGGWTLTSPLAASDTWVWDGGSWLLLSNNLPGSTGARAGAAGTFDESRGQVIFHGGYRYQAGLYNDTWGQTDTTWEVLTAGTPSARWNHSMAFDSQRDTVVLFGGNGAGIVDDPVLFHDTWEWSAGEWSLVSESGPSPRFGHAMAYDETRGVVVLFGGANSTHPDESNYFGDTWEWDGTQWLEVPIDGPDARYLHSMVYDSARHVIVLNGGASAAGLLDDTWEYDGVWHRVDGAGGEACSAHRATFDRSRNRTVLFGGNRDPYPNTYLSRETWEFDGAAWVEAGPPNVNTTGLIAMAFNSVRNELVLIGEVEVKSETRTKYRTWVYGDGHWRSVPNLPFTPHRGSPMVCDSQRGVMVLHGDRDANPARTWEFDGTNWTLAADSGTPPSSGQMAYDAARGVCVFLTSTSSPESWLWDGVNWTSEGTIPFSGPWNMAYDAQREVVVALGSGSVWERDGNGWHQQAASAESQSGLSAMFYHGGLGRVVRMIRQSPTQWILRVWDGAQWTTQSLPASDTTLLFGVLGAVWDSGDGSILVFEDLNAPYDEPVSDRLMRVGTFGRAGDCNCDGQVNNFDIDTFVAALSGDVFEYHLAGGSLSCWRARSCWADTNQDGLVNNFDIDAFVALLGE